MTSEANASAEVDPVRSPSVPPGLAPTMIIAGKYELVRKLGSGSMGEVWAARHLTLHEEVAIKLVLRDVSHEDGTTAEERFLFEARVAATLSRKTRHIVGVTDHGQDGRMAYLVMELLTGESLGERIERVGPLPLAKAAPILSQVARGLAYAHAEGVVHRDLKPSNLFVTVDEEGRALVKILDFGIAKLRGSGRRIRLNRFASPHATSHGFLLGTPAFMSPEQATGKQLDHRVDVWALAVIAYHLLTGEHPFDGDNVDALLARLIAVIPTPIRSFRSDLPQVVEDFFSRAFHPIMEERFQSAAALVSAFEQLEPLAKGAVVSIPPQALTGGAADLALPPGNRRDDPPSTMVAAGVPRRGSARRTALASAVLLFVFGVTGALLQVYYERDPVLAATQSPSSYEPGPAITANVTIRAADLPPTRVTAAPPSRPALGTAVVRAQLPPPPPAPEPAASGRQRDRSDVF